MKLGITIGICLTLTITMSSWAEDWPQWRGPFFNGSTNETNLPSNWSQTKNIAWSAELPGISAATPVVWKDKVFVSSTDATSESLLALCFDRNTGDLLWQHTVADGVRKDSRSTYSSPSPATNGKVVVFFYGNGPMVAYDFGGKQLWSRNIQEDFGPFAFGWTFSSSPLLFEGKLYLQVLQRDVPVDGRGFKDRFNHSYLLALDPGTGEKIWQHIRPSQAKKESREGFTSPVPFEWQGRKELLVVGGDDLTGHNPENGAELWRWGTWNPTRIGHWRLVPSPVAGEDVILVCAPKRDPIYAVKAGGKGPLDDNAIAWISTSEKKLSSDVPTPAFYDGDFFVLSDVRKSLSRVKPRTGKVVWSIRTPGNSKYEASPLVADGKIYLINFAGEVVVVATVDGKILSEISMEDSLEQPVRSSVIAARGQLFIRTNTRLFCVGG